MDYTGHGSTRNGGVLNLDAVTFTGSHLRATGSFGFVLTPAGKAAKVEYWIGILMGRHGRQRYPGPIAGDMTDFDFNPLRVNARVQTQMDGCRDWIAQAVTRFYLVGLVTLCGQELEVTPALYDGEPVTYLNFNATIPNRSDSIQPAPFWFPDIIDKKFVMTPTAQHPRGVTIQSVPMWRGKFYDSNVVRSETVNVYNGNMSEHFTFRYNYHELPRPGSASGRPGGSPPSQPPPGGSGGSGAPSSSSSGGSGAKKPTSVPNPGQPVGPPRPSAGAGAGASTGGNPGNRNQDSGTPSGGKPQSGQAPTVAKKHAWVPVKIKGQDKGSRDENARPDKHGWVPVYSNKLHTGHFNPKTQEYKLKSP
ncbi:hypothetical protein SLS64_013823 [Diaporthe eres]|uniref:Uncharacterized protein n=1 Tax=Diaporthe eres TaxID=83184 RepID=A0ABR1PC43_DIAER